MTIDQLVAILRSIGLTVTVDEAAKTITLEESCSDINWLHSMCEKPSTQGPVPEEGPETSSSSG